MRNANTTVHQQVTRLWNYVACFISIKFSLVNYVPLYLRLFYLIALQNQVSAPSSCVVSFALTIADVTGVSCFKQAV